MIEHLPVELAELVRRLDAEIVDQRPPEGVVLAQRVDLAAAAVEREQLLRPEPLAPRFVGECIADGRQHLDVPAGGEERVVADLVDGRVQLADLALRLFVERERRQVLQWFRGPAGERRLQDLGRAIGLVVA